MSALPIIDLGPLRVGDAREQERVAGEVGAACAADGFFYAVGHAIPPATLARLDAAARRFFALPEAAKQRVAMTRGGRAWRGWFPLGGELTSGQPDRKEGYYFGSELPAEHPRVRAGLPLHGANLFPDEVPELGPAVLESMAAFATVGHALMRAISLSLGLPADWFHRHYTEEPTLLFRIFRYPPAPPASPDWGVGEHTDYGLLTLLAQDESGGLEVKTRKGWVAAPPVAGALVCNIGDMLDKLTGGRYRSVPHRVRNTGRGDRLSFPFFFDPDFLAPMRPLPGAATADASADAAARWDHASVHDFSGTYGDYLLRKVGRVFPDLSAAVL